MVASSKSNHRRNKKDARRFNRRIAKANTLKRGKWYLFHGYPPTSVNNQTPLFARPSIHSSVIALIPHDTLVMFLEVVEKPEEDTLRGGLRKLVKVGCKDMFGYLACYFCAGDVFRPSTYFQSVR